MHPLRSWLLAALLPATLLLGGCGAPDTHAPATTDPSARATETTTPAPEPNTDPLAGWVVLEETLYTSLKKRCDGTSLLYLVRGSDRGEDLEVVPDAAECDAWR